jgi:hypothetical protein
MVTAMLGPVVNAAAVVAAPAAAVELGANKLSSQ